MTDKTEKSRASFVALTGDRKTPPKPAGKLSEAGSLHITEMEMELNREGSQIMWIESLSIRLNAPHPTFRPGEAVVIEQDEKTNAPISLLIRDKGDSLRFRIKPSQEGALYRDFLGTSLADGLEALTIGGGNTLVQKVNAEIGSAYNRKITHEKIRATFAPEPSRSR